MDTVDGLYWPRLTSLSIEVQKRLLHPKHWDGFIIFELELNSREDELAFGAYYVLAFCVLMPCLTTLVMTSAASTKLIPHSWMSTCIGLMYMYALAYGI